MTGRAVAGLDPPVRQVLRLGLYELLELNMVDYAVSEYVDVAKAMAGPGVGGFVNGAQNKRTDDSVVIGQTRNWIGGGGGNVKSGYQS